MDRLIEKRKQDKFEWERSGFYNQYSEVLGYYQAKTCIENANCGSVLDLACGDGILTKIFAEHYERVVGVDASHIHLEKAKETVKNAIFYESLIEDFKTEEKFDNIFMLNILEHVENPIDILKKAASFLKEEGTLIVQVPNCDAINRKIAVIMGTLLSCDELSPFDINIAGHRRSYNLQTLTDEIKNANLKVVKTGGVFYKMLSTPQINWFLKEGLWEKEEFGWGRVGSEKQDWRAKFCEACYEIGKERPEDCNVIYAVIKNK